MDRDMSIAPEETIKEEKKSNYKLKDFLRLIMSVLRNHCLLSVCF